MIQNIKNEALLTFADVFAGCGGISLGLNNAGWQGRFAIEKNANAFETLKTNFVEGQQGDFNWPEWLPKEAISTSDLLKNHSKNLGELQGKISLLAGNPSCQGISWQAVEPTPIYATRLLKLTLSLSKNCSQAYYSLRMCEVLLYRSTSHTQRRSLHIRKMAGLPRREQGNRAVFLCPPRRTT